MSLTPRTPAAVVRVAAFVVALVMSFGTSSVVLAQEGNLAARILPIEALPGYQLADARIDENFPREHSVVYTLADLEDVLVQPVAIAVDIVVTGDQPADGVANFIFAHTVENFVDGFIKAAGATEAHYEAYDGMLIVPGTRWTRLDFELGELPGSGFVVAFPWEQGMAFAIEIGFFDIATADDTAELGIAVAARVGAITL